MIHLSVLCACMYSQITNSKLFVREDSSSSSTNNSNYRSGNGTTIATATSQHLCPDPIASQLMVMDAITNGADAMTCNLSAAEMESNNNDNNNTNNYNNSDNASVRDIRSVFLPVCTSQL